MSERRRNKSGRWSKGKNLLQRTPPFYRLQTALAFLLVLSMLPYNESYTRISLISKQQTNTSSFIEKGLGVVESVSFIRGGDELGILDRLARSLVLLLGWTVAFQSLGTTVTANEHQLLNKVSRRLLSHESAAALRTILQILISIDSHGIVDVFGKYRNRDIWEAVNALSRLSRAASLHDRRGQEFPIVEDKELVKELAHYAVYANSAYGWKMDLAFRRRLHLGDLQALLRRTGISREDVVATKWESKTHRPAYFIVRDRIKKTLVLCIRGTWSAHDVLTDLCCTAEEVEAPRSSPSTRGFLSDLFCFVEEYRGIKSHLPFRAHHGMLEAARAVKEDAEESIKKELANNPDYALVLVGHSMGGGVATLLAALWEKTFPDLMVYVYGPPCVAPIEAKLTGNRKIISVVTEGDPFCCLSLGHVADASKGLSLLCEDSDLRKSILIRTHGRIEELEDRNLEWCYDTMEQLRGSMSGEKLFPPGRILFISRGRKNSDQCIREVPSSFFRDLHITPRMFDLTRHVPHLYETSLQRISGETAW